MSRQVDQVLTAIALRVALATAALACCRTLAVPSRLQLGVELSDRAEDLSHQNGCRRILCEEIRCCRRDQRLTPRPAVSIGSSRRVPLARASAAGSKPLAEGGSSILRTPIIR